MGVGSWWFRGGESVPPLQLALALSVSLCGLIVPLLCRLYKSTPAGLLGDSSDRPTPDDRLIIKLSSSSSKRR